MKDLWRELAEVGLTERIRNELAERLGERGRKALRAVEEGRVKRYLDFFVVVGYEDEYVVDGEFCTCDDFLYRRHECVHILAVRIALAAGACEEYRLWYYPNLRGLEAQRNTLSLPEE